VIAIGPITTPTVVTSLVMVAIRTTDNTSEVMPLPTQLILFSCLSSRTTAQQNNQPKMAVAMAVAANDNQNKQ
jgi:hypothetical protein